MTTVLINALVLFGGLLVGVPLGYAVRAVKERRTEAPVPLDNGYDENNPINGRGRHGETVTISGYEWKIM